MSRGIGANYMYRFKHPRCFFTTKCSLFTKSAIVEYHNRKPDNVKVSLTNGIILPLPKFYRERIYDERERRKVTQYMQQRYDVLTAKRVEHIMRSTGNSEEKVLHDLFVEPFISTFGLKPQRVSLF